MANEILIAAQLSLSPAQAGANPFRRDWQMVANQTPGTKIVQGIGTAGTAAAVVSMGAITAPGLAWFKNLHATGTLTIRNGSGGADVVKLLAGEQYAFRFLSTAVPYCVGSVASVTYEYAILET